MAWCARGEHGGVRGRLLRTAMGVAASVCRWSRRARRQHGQSSFPPSPWRSSKHGRRGGGRGGPCLLSGGLVEDDAVNLWGREEVVAIPAAAAAGVDGVRRRGRERHEIRLRQRSEVHDGCHLRPHCPLRRHRRRLWADGKGGFGGLAQEEGNAGGLRDATRTMGTGEVRCGKWGGKWSGPHDRTVTVPSIFVRHLIKPWTASTEPG